MARVDAGVVGGVELNTGGDLTDPALAGRIPGTHEPAFWAHVAFAVAVAFLAFTYFGGFRRIG